MAMKRVAFWLGWAFCSFLSWGMFIGVNTCDFPDQSPVSFGIVTSALAEALDGGSVMKIGIVVLVSLVAAYLGTRLPALANVMNLAYVQRHHCTLRGQTQDFSAVTFGIRTTVMGDDIWACTDPETTVLVQR
jgi:hypothetical protein